MSGILNIAINAAYNAGNIIQQYARFLSNILVEKKGINNFVTEVDRKAEEIIIQTILKAFPNHNILGEETGLMDNGSNVTWIIDPLDGTTNFIHNNRQYAVSIAVREGNNITHGVILDPNRNDLYTATLGKGAKLNDKRIRVSNIKTLTNSLIGSGPPSYDLPLVEQYTNIFKEMLRSTSGLRCSGSAALDLAFVASGNLDGFWEFNLKPWDIAAGCLLIKEAGGLICDFNGNQDYLKSGNIIASNAKIISPMLKLIQKSFSET